MVAVVTQEEPSGGEGEFDHFQIKSLSDIKSVGFQLSMEPKLLELCVSAPRELQGR